MSEPKKTEVAIALYASARMELIERIKLRDQIILIYLAATGVIYGISFSNTLRLELLLLLPFLALGTSILISQHHSVIGYLGKYCANEIGKYFSGLDCSAPQWDSSESLNEVRHSAMFNRKVGHIIIVLIPSGLSVCINYQHIMSPFPYGYVWLFSLLCFLSSIYIILKTDSIRTKLYETTNWQAIK